MNEEPEILPKYTTALGQLTGEVWAVFVNKNGYKFAFRDEVMGANVYVQLEPEDEAIVHQIVGKRVEITGLVVREYETGIPRRIEDVWKVELAQPKTRGTIKPFNGLCL